MKIILALVVSSLTLVPLLAEDVGYAGSGSARAVSQGLDPALKDAPYRDDTLDVEKRIDDLVGRMTLFEKFKVLHCRTGSSAGGIPRIGLSEFLTCDGGVGPRVESRAGITYVPCGIASAASWDGELAEEVGRVLGEETRAVFPAGEGRVAKILLGPGGNIGGRTPFGARSFEYLGEDPLLAGRLAGRFAKGLQSVKVSPCMKHYVCNDQEWCRTMIDVKVGERALREIYVRPFEIAIREGGVWSIMNSYNAVNGEWTSWNRRINDILYRDCGWDGALLSDWGGYRNDLKAIAGGSTVETYCEDDPAQYRREIEDLKAGRISQADLDDQLRRALRLYFRVGAFDTDKPSEKKLQERCEKAFRSEAHRELAYRAAAESFVLLENRDGFLPVNAAKVRTVAVVGPNADQYHTMIDGSWLGLRGGSAAVKAAREITPLEGFCQVFGERNVFFAPGFRFENGDRPNAVSVPALKAMDPFEAARRADLVVFCGGYDHSVDREVLGWGYFENADREYLTLQPGPKGESQEDLIRKIAAVNPNTVVAVTCGGPFTTEGFRDAVKGIVVTWYGGEFGGRVLADLILGEVNPSGRLPYTFGRQPSDWPSVAKGGRCYLGEITKPLEKYTEADCGIIRAEREYADGIWVGYRAFDHFGTKPLYPFGHGLSYTTFALAKGESPNTVKVTNTGARRGRAVVQAYVTKPSVPGVEMPVKELADFASVVLEPGETKSVTFKVGEDSLRYWDERANGWRRPAGEFRLRVGFDAATLPVELRMGS